MAATLAFPSLQTIFDAVGRFIPGAKVYYFVTGTTAPLDVFTTADLDVPHARPIEADAGGRIPPVYVGEGTYKFRLMDAEGTLLEEVDGVQGAVPVPDTPPDPPDPGTPVPTGSLRASISTAIESGWVRANGRTLGSAASSGTELANASANALFLKLWNEMPSLAVSGGRGASAVADWAANKTIVIPSLRGRSIIGRDSMGNTAAGVITTATFADPDLLGAVGGTELVNLTIDNIAEFTLTGSTADAGLHDHTPGGTTSTTGAHVHTYPDNSAPNTISIFGAGSGVLVPLTEPPTVDTTRSTASNGDHAHTVTLPDDGTHDHDVTIDPAGGGDAHSNMQPSFLATIYIKL